MSSRDSERQRVRRPPEALGAAVPFGIGDISERPALGESPRCGMIPARARRAWRCEPSFSTTRVGS